MSGLMEGKSGLVTGAAGGIGRATALTLAREGASVLVNDLESRRADGEETVRQIEELGGTAFFSAADISSAADNARLVEEAVATFGALDYAHNNAGVELHASITETTEADFDRIISVNLKGVWLGMKYQIPQMVKQGCGAIVNTASLAGLISAPELGAYVASKHGVVGLTKTAAVECADRNVRVNAVCPALIRTPMTEGISPDYLDVLIAPHAMKRIGEPSEVAEAVVWLLSDRASFVTGTPMPVDAGSTAY